MSPDESDLRRVVTEATAALDDVEDLTHADWQALEGEGLWRKWRVGEERPIDVWLRLGIVGGRLACTGMVVEPIEGGLQARDLREIRVTELVAMMESNGTLASVEADDQARAVGTATEHDETRPVTVHATAASAVAAVGKVTVNARSSHPGPKGWPDEHYQKVAVHYREALLHHPRSPMKWAAETWPTSDASMRRWVKRARVLGYLRDDEQ